MNDARLLQLAELLEHDASNETGVKFDLNTWASPASPASVAGRGNYFPVDTVDIPVACSTSACALGLAALSKIFEKDGLSYYIDGRMDQERLMDDGTIKVVQVGNMIPQHVDAEGYTHEGYNAGASLFGITEPQSQFLFDPEAYIDTPIGAEGERFVAQRIRQFVDTQGASASSWINGDDEDDYDNED